MEQMQGRWDGRILVLFNCLKMADTFAVCQSGGKAAVSSYRWSAGARESAQFFKMTLGIWSGPQALWGLMALSNLHSPAVLMLNALIIGCCGGVNVWGSTVELVHENLNLLLAVTHTSEPFCFGGLLQCCLVFCF